MKKAFFQNLKFDVFDSVYEPREDSFLLAEQVQLHALKGSQVLDLGCGTGIQGIIASMNGAEVIAVDENENAVENTRHNAKKLGQNILVLQGNLFSALKKLSKQKYCFDLIIFNPPYLPSNEIKDKAIDALNDGLHFINFFLEKLAFFLKPEGKALLLVSSLNKPKKVINKAKKLGFNVEIKARKKLFFEELFVFELKPKKANN